MPRLGWIGLLPLLALGADNQVPSFPAKADLVILAATAVDRNGRPVQDLRREDFRILEDGKPQRVVHFAHSRALDARILLLVDTSGSMSGRPKTTSAWMAAFRYAALQRGHLRSDPASNLPQPSGWTRKVMGRRRFGCDHHPSLP